MSSIDMRQEIFELYNKMDGHALCLKQLVNNAWRACYITNVFILMGLIGDIRGRRMMAEFKPRIWQG